MDEEFWNFFGPLGSFGSYSFWIAGATKRPKYTSGKHALYNKCIFLFCLFDFDKTLGFKIYFYYAYEVSFSIRGTYKPTHRNFRIYGS